MNNLNIKIEKFESFMDKLKGEGKLVGASVAFVYKDEIIYAKGFGKSKISPKEDITPDTIMSIQSITKSFASSSIMQLVERGLIELDKPLIKYLPYFKTSNKKESDKITVRQLLSHTAGLPRNISIANMVCSNRDEIEGFKDMQKEMGISDEVIEGIKSFEDITRYFKDADLDYEPGKDWMYCTDGYAIVGDLFEKVSGVSWHDYVQDNIFNKLNMTRTTLDPVRAKSDKDSARYHIEKEGSLKEVPFPTNPIAAPIGFIYSTAIDMAKYLGAHMSYENSPILNSYSLREMQKPYPGVEVGLPIPNVKDVGYGLGWATGIYKGQSLVEHGGGYSGVRTNVSMVPSEKLGIVVLTNYQESDPHKICQRAIDILLELE